ncbi:MAG: SPFH domain-containing protein [Candidatus Cloacimonetes bacterium]|nr:SPFH domain-containing protein [Candidatus Cloacimonadota bacterium]MCF8357080.1 SPFH domain-containing protein [Melioribacteraceae bacterium]
MSLFNKKRTDGKTNDYIYNNRKGIIDRIKFDGPNETLVWKFPYDNLTIGAQLIVNESQEAIFYKGGQALDLFGPGTHTLSTSNIPLLQKLINLPFGGRTPFTAEIWFINKTIKRDTKWGTKDPIKIQDPNFKIIIPVRAFGEFGIQISDSRNFMTQIVGTLHTAEIQTITKHFSTLIITKTKDTIGDYIINKKISVLDLPAKIDEISNICKNKILDEFDKYGILITNFYIESINYPDDNPSVLKLQDALAKKAEMDIVGYTYQQERTYDTLETAAGNEGNSGNLMGAGMGLGMGVGVGGAFGGAMSKMGSQLSPDQQPNIRCTKCNSDNPANSKFCYNCGSKLMINKFKCPKCGSENSEGTKFCGECGLNLQEIKCPKCGNVNSPNTKFCSECGEKL